MAPGATDERQTAANTSPYKDMKSYFNDQAKNYEDIAPTMKSIASRSLALLKQIPTFPQLDSKSHIHDNACGPGIYTVEVLQTLNAASIEQPPVIYATDYAEGMIAHLEMKHLVPNVKAQVMDSLDLKFRNESFTHSFMGFGIQSMPDSQQALKEVHRTLRAGGCAVVSIWSYVGWVEIVEATRRIVDPDGPAFTGPNASPWAGEKCIGQIREVFGDAGFNVDDDSTVIVKEMREKMTVTDWAKSGSDTFGKMVIGWFTGTWGEKKAGEFSRTYERLLQEEVEKEKREGTEGWDMIAQVVFARK